MVEQNVASIMVTYNPESDVIGNVKSIISSCVHLVIVDNGSSKETKEYLKSIENESKVTIIYYAKNMGLGHALNEGIRFILQSKELSYINWIATFDQDSKVENDYFIKMLNSYEKFNNKEKVAILAPNWIEQKLEDGRNSQSEGKNELVEQKTVITSGSLIKKNIFEEIGFFEEDFFIDFLDIEFCLRARKNSYKIYMVPDISMVHNLGNTKQHKLLGSTVMATNHNYIRRYYITRNRLYTYKKYFRSEFEWFKGDFVATVKEFIIIFLFEKNRLKKLSSMLRGVFDAVIGKKGPL
jgi:rhamnosyltransferase